MSCNLAKYRRNAQSAETAIICCKVSDTKQIDKVKQDILLSIDKEWTKTHDSFNCLAFSDQTFHMTIH